MSLLVWLPLNNNLTNQGLLDLNFNIVNNSGALSSSSTGGKVVPGLYKRTTKETADYIISNKNIVLDGDVTMCCWAKVTGVGYSTSANGLFGQHGHNTGGLGITMKDVSSTDLRMSVNTGLYGDSHGSSSDRTFCTYYGSTNIYNAWHHLCLTYDSKTKQLRMYVDGKLENIQGYGSYVTLKGNNTTARPVILFAWSTDHVASPNYRPPCELNDVRIYDHILSPKEIKTVAQGLVAHYQLKGMGRTNYMKGTYKYTQNNPIIRNVTDSSVYNDSYVYYDLSDLSIVVPSDGTYTIVMKTNGVLPSGHVTGSSAASERRLGIFIQNTSTSTHYFWSNYGTSISGEVYGSFSLPAGTYKFRTNLYAADNVNYQVKIWDIKVVAGSYSLDDTWCPDETDLGMTVSPVGMDSSGYGNHLTRSGTIPLVSGSPRYGSCADFNQTGYLKRTNFNMTTNAFTVSFWLNPPYTITGQHFICGTFNNWTNNGLGIWRDSTGGNYSSLIKSNSESSYAGIPGISCTHDAWQHIAYTYDGTTTIYYKNGVEQSRTSYGSNGTISHPVLYLGNSMYSETTSQIDEACMSDFRFYATALSATDVADLYNNSASISKDGTMFAYDFNENKRNTVDKTGIVISNSFSTNSTPTYEMKTKTLEDQSTWARIHYLDVASDKTFFANSAEVLKCLNKSNRYSRMGDVEKFKSSPGCRLPAGYTELEYLESSGTQYINTGINPNQDTRIVIKARLSTPHSIYGVNVSGASFNMTGSTNGMYYYWAGQGNTAITNYYDQIHTFEQNKNICKVDGILYHTYTYSTWSAACPMFLFGRNNGSALNDAGTVRIYSCQIYDNGKLVRNYVPCKNTSGILGMYDLVNNTFYANAGTGTFASGEFVSKYEFMLTYPNLNAEYNRWTQTSSPNATSVNGYNPISIAWSAHSAGIRKHGSDCLYNCDSGDTWYAPIGQYKIWDAGIPGANSSAQSATELWVRIDKFNKATQTKIYNGSIIASNFIEL